MTSLSDAGRDRRALAAGAVAIILLLGVGRGIPALAATTRLHRERAAGLEAQVVNVREALATARQNALALHAAHIQLTALDSAILEGGSPGQAGAELSALLARTSEFAEARLVSVQLGEDSTGARGTFSRVKARATFTGDISAVAYLLQSLEAGPEAIVVRELSVASSASTSLAQPEVLQVELALDALYRPSRKKP